MLFLFLATLAQAAEFKCVAPFDDSSYYQVVGTTAGKVLDFSYVTNDGLDMKAKLKVSAASVEPGKSITFEGANGSMTIKGRADFVPQENNFQGALQVQFSLDGTPSVETGMICTLR